MDDMSDELILAYSMLISIGLFMVFVSLFHRFLDGSLRWPFPLF